MSQENKEIAADKLLTIIDLSIAASVTTLIAIMMFCN